MTTSPSCAECATPFNKADILPVHLLTVILSSCSHPLPQLVPTPEVAAQLSQALITSYKEERDQKKKRKAEDGGEKKGEDGAAEHKAKKPKRPID